jgi:hypothetical protein
MLAGVLSLAVLNIGVRTIAATWLHDLRGRKMGAMKLQQDDIESVRAELDYYKHKAEYYRSGLNQIVQMERYPRESGSSVYDGIYPTGAFAVKVLKGEWEK